jgi:outer membrane protein assembly factor BamB
VNTNKRMASAALGLAAILATAAAPAQAVAPATALAPTSTWTQDGYGAGSTGYNPYESQLNLGTIAALRQRWSATPGAGEEGCETTPEPPLVADGRVVMFESGGVGARDARTGGRLWLNTGFSYLGRTLAIADGLVIATDTSCQSQSDYEGTISALNAATGALVWESSQAGTVDKLVADAGVLVTHGYCGVCVEEHDQVVAYRVSDGQQLWSRDFATLAGPVSAAGRVLLTSTDGTFGTLAVSLWTGDISWRSRLAWVALSASPAGDRFLARRGTGFSSINSRTGLVAWSVRSTVDSLSSDGRRVFASGGVLTAYAAGTGRRLWSRGLTEPGKPVRAGGLLYVTNGGPALAILSPVNGSRLADGTRYRTAIGHVVVAGARLFTTDGTSIRAYAF